MPKLACWSCGRQIDTVAPIDALAAEGRRCPRCGAFLNAERRDGERRRSRDQDPANDPGPPETDEVREEEQRTIRRRKPVGT